MAKVVEIIVSEVKRGTGTCSSPYREVIQYWTLEGELLAESFEEAEFKVQSLQDELKRVKKQQEDLVIVLMAITDGPPGKRVIRIEKAREMVHEVLAATR